MASLPVRSTTSVRPVIRWAGSKRLLVPKLSYLAPNSFKRYVEPFVGSACLFLALKPKAAVLSDLNPHLISTYKEIRKNPEAVAAAMCEWRATRDDYIKARALRIAGDDTRAAARFLFLNRYSFNGVYRENQNGEFNVPWGGGRSGNLPTIAELGAVARALKSVTLARSDFEPIIRSTHAGDFLYLDPPYHYGDGRNRGEYGYGAFGLQDMERFVASVLDAHDRGVKILISYNKAHSLLRALPNWKLHYSPVRRSVAGFCENRREVREYM
jgi:DNA adenine methylase